MRLGGVTSRLVHSVERNPIGHEPMNMNPPFADMFQSALDHRTGGVVRLVQDLLALCQEQGLELDWRTDCCRVRSVASGLEAVFTQPLRKSVFRVLLARLAVLCNERSPNSVSPYGGQG